MRPRAVIGTATAVLFLAACAAAASPAWIARSNQNARLLLDLRARFNPESAVTDGAGDVDERIIDLKPGFDERFRAATLQARDTLQSRLKTEPDPNVRRDLRILITATDDTLRGMDLQRKYHVRYFNVARLMYSGVKVLLDGEVPAGRRQRALLRLRRYAGLEPGYEPITALAEARTRESLKPGLVAPAKAQLERDIANSDLFLAQIEQLFRQYRIEGYREAYARLRSQVATYNAFLRGQVMPFARQDFRLPPDEYADRLQDVGVSIPPDQLAAMAHAAFEDCQRQIQAIAPQVAKARGLSSDDYRDVLRDLKREQLYGEKILPFYEARLRDVEAIIRREHLLTLPARPATLRLASAAESEAFPAPHTRQPRLTGNSGEHAEFIVPLNYPAPPGTKEAMQQFDDFTYQAASWTVTAHELRPGHALQYDTMVDNGTSIARALFAYNTTDVEGWGLYAEAIVFPYMPPEGQMASLRSRLMRALRAFLDPEVQQGKTAPAAAQALLKKDLVLSDHFAQLEVDRYTWGSPGQAPAFFYGFAKMMALRSDTEKALGARFDPQKFNDFVLAQGLLPPDLLREAVMEDLVAPALAAAGSVQR